MLTNWCFFGFDQFQGAFLSTCFLSRGLALFQQFVDDAGSWIASSKTSRLPNQRKLTVPLYPCKKQFELPVDCNDDVETFPASPHDKDVMPKTQGVTYREPVVQRVFRKSRPKIRLNLTWQIEHVFGQNTCQKSVQKTNQATRGDDRTGTRSAEAQALRKLINRLFLRC